jgi:Cof subfamily protein (haloacid dehalogenase superfamily)
MAARRIVRRKEGVLMSHRRSPPSRIAAVLSDIDGTLVTDDKVLTDRARNAVAALYARGMMFSIVSSRPPRAMRMFVEPLRLVAPMAAFNGGLLISPEGVPLSRHFLPPATARRTLDILASHNVQPWVFTENEWFALDGSGPDVARERFVLQFAPTIVADFGGALDGAAKIVGVSRNPDDLSRCEAAVRDGQPGMTTVGRSNPRHFDVTHPLANKGAALRAMAQWLGMKPGRFAAIGDGENDIPMFVQAGFSIAMGNAGADVQSRADRVTAPCNDDGFARAMESLLDELAGDNQLSRGPP